MKKWNFMIVEKRYNTKVNDENCVLREWRKKMRMKDDAREEGDQSTLIYIAP